MESTGAIKAYRLCGSGFFLTYPRCDLSKEKVLDHLKTIGQVKSAVVAEEKHKDGTPHVHAFVKYQKRLDIRSSKYFDIESFHGNYQTAKCSYAVEKYCKKAGEFLEYGDIDITQAAEARLSKKTILGKRLCSGEPLVDVVEDNPELLFGYSKLKADVTAFLEDKSRSKPTCEGHIPNDWELELPLLTGK